MSGARANGSGRFAGVWPIATTPFRADGSLDLKGLTRVVEHILFTPTRPGAVLAEMRARRIPR